MINFNPKPVCIDHRIFLQDLGQDIYIYTSEMVNVAVFFLSTLFVDVVTYCNFLIHVFGCSNWSHADSRFRWHISTNSPVHVTDVFLPGLAGSTFCRDGSSFFGNVDDILKDPTNTVSLYTCIL